MSKKRKAPPQKEHWFTLRSPHGDLRVYLVSEIRGGSDGEFWPDSREIFIVAKKNVSAILSTLIHELLHASVSHFSGHLREACFGKNTTKREERVVGFIEPGLFALLNDNHMLQLPKMPKLRKG